MKAIRLQTEYMDSPIGLDIVNPHLFWNCEGGEKQSAYQIIATVNDKTVWDTNKVISNKMTHIEYTGEILSSRDIVEWSICLWDENDIQGEFSSTTFELGLLNDEDWTSKWITAPIDIQESQRYPVDYFKKDFNLDKTVKYARLYATAAGVYEVGINGKMIEDFYLAPGTTDYRKRVQYQVYDVTKYLREKDNSIDIKLGDGWYRGSVGCFGQIEVFGNQTAVKLQLEIYFSDNSKIIVNSDESFQWSNDGSLRFSDLKDGEIFDANMQPSYASNAKLLDLKMNITASNNVYVKKQERFKPTLIISPNGKKILDFHQNLAGIISFNIKGGKGEKLQLRFGEILDEQGEFTQENFIQYKPKGKINRDDELKLIMGQKDKIEGKLQITPKQEIQYICNGVNDFYTSTFCIFGFRYVEVKSDMEINANDFTAIAVYSDMEETGTFECSNKKVNQFYSNTVWSMKGNFADVPTDCPTRERMAWTGDGQIFFKTAAYIMNVASFYRKWMNDFADGQFKDGRNSAVIPYSAFDMLYRNTGGSVGWADAIVLIPYRFWKVYNDKRIICDFYENMKKYADFIIHNCGMKNEEEANKNPYNKYTYEKGFHLGEWLEPDDIRPKDFSNKPSRAEECTAYLHYTMSCMEEIADELNLQEDAKVYSEYVKGSKAAYNHLFLSNGLIDSTQQAKYVRPLAFNLINDKYRNENEHILKNRVVEREYRIGTGFLSTPFILPVLAEAGFVEEAYKMLENEEKPGWLAEVNAGATTVWENWDGKRGSHNHYSPGSVCEWLFEGVCGIKTDKENHFIINPKLGGTLSYAKASYKSIYGVIKSSWKRVAAVDTLEVNIPSNTTATVTFSGKTYKVSAGVHTFESSK